MTQARRVRDVTNTELADLGGLICDCVPFESIVVATECLAKSRVWWQKSREHTVHLQRYPESEALPP